MSIAIALLLVLVVSVAIAHRWFLIRDVFGSTPLRQHVDPVLAPYLGKHPVGDELAALERQVHSPFIDCVTEYGLYVGEWRARLKMDELLGPVCVIVGPEGNEIPLARFDQQLAGRRAQALQGPLHR